MTARLRNATKKHLEGLVFSVIVGVFDAVKLRSFTDWRKESALKNARDLTPVLWQAVAEDLDGHH